MTTLLSAGEVAAWPCMTPEEYDLWRLDRGAKIPCADCPVWFAEQARAVGRCTGRPGEWPRRQRAVAAPEVREPLPARARRPNVRKVGGRLVGGRGNGYATPAERLAARRETWRESKRRARCNDAPGGAQ